MSIDWMKSIAMGTLALAAIGQAPARADIVTVEGTSRIDTVVDDPKLAATGIVLAPGELVSFSYAYDTCTMSGASQLVATGTTSSMVGDQVFATEFDDYEYPESQIVIDGYQAGGFETRNGVFTSYIIDLTDAEHTILALGPDAYLDMLSDWEDTRFLVGVASDDYPADGWGWRYLVEGDITALTSTVTAGPPCGGANDDLDGDGVPNAQDACAGTSTGDVVDAQGCSIDDLVPCAGPRAGGAWHNHGEYMSTLTQVARAMFKAGLITADERDALIGKAAASSCGH